MRSLNYLVKGKPTRFDDCIDYTHTSKPHCVSVELSYREMIGYSSISTYLLAKYLWEFPERKVECQNCYGVVFFDQPPEKQKQCIKRANARLQEDLTRLQALGVIINQNHSAFTCSAIY